MGIIYVDGGYRPISSSKLEVVTEKNKTQDDRLDVLEELVLSGSGDSSTGNLDVLNTMIKNNTASIQELKVLSQANSEQLTILTGDETIEGSVDYKISEAFKWKDL